MANPPQLELETHMSNTTPQNPILLLVRQAAEENWCTSPTCSDCDNYHLTEAAEELFARVGKRPAQKALRQALKDPHLKPREFGWLVSCAVGRLPRLERARIQVRALQLAISSFDPDLIEAVLLSIPSDWPFLGKLAQAGAGMDEGKIRNILGASREARVEEEAE